MFRIHIYTCVCVCMRHLSEGSPPNKIYSYLNERRAKDTEKEVNVRRRDNIGRLYTNIYVYMNTRARGILMGSSGRPACNTLLYYVRRDSVRRGKGGRVYRCVCVCVFFVFRFRNK